MNIKPVVTALAVIFVLSVTCEPVWAQMALSPEPQLSRPQSERQSGKALAENKFYAKVYGFYGLLSPGGFSGQSSEPTTTYFYSSGDRNVIESKDYKSEKSAGLGLRAGGGVGLVVNDFINLGMDGEYTLGSAVTESYTVVNQYIYGNNTVGSSQESKVQRNYQYRTVNIIPNITFKAVSKAEYYIYNRLGVMVAIPMQYSYETIRTDIYAWNPGRPQTFRTTHDLDKSIGVGYQAALGIQFRIADNLRGYSELVLSSFQLKTNGGNLSKNTYTYISDENQSVTQDEPINETNRRIENLNLKIPVSSIGIGVGLAFRF